MKNNMRKVLSLVLAMLMCITSLPLFASADEVRQPREWFVSLEGNDESGDGSIDKPFRTLQKGVDMLQAGDTLYIRGGTYNEGFTMHSSGTAEAPITVKNYNDEEVVIRATERLTDWTKSSDNIWKTAYPYDFRINANKTGGTIGYNDGLYNGSKPLVVARYPNLTDSGDKLRFNKLEMDSGTIRYDKPGSNMTKRGTIYDAELTQPDGYWNGAILHMESGLNWANSEAVIKDFKTGVIEAGEHTHDGDTWDAERAGDLYYIYNHINALDCEDEFYIDYENQEVYVYSETDPNTLDIGAVVSQALFDVSDVAYVNFSGITGAGATPKLNDNTSYVNFDWFKISGYTQPFALYGNHNTIRHSHLSDTPGSLLHIYGEYNAVFNSLLEYSNWFGGWSPAVDVMEHSLYAYVGYNTIRYSGRTGIQPAGAAALYEYNNIHDAAYLTCDTGLTYSGYISPGFPEFRYNWLHDNHAKSVCAGLYLDGTTSMFSLHHNVVWDHDDDGNLRKDGDFISLLLNDPAEGYSIYNNTFIGDSHQSHTMHLMENTRYINNIFAGEIQMGVENKMRDKNLVGWLDAGFKDFDGEDFSLSADSIAIDKGRVIEGITDGYVGDAPDLGAYEYGVEPWIPGHNWEEVPEFVHHTPNADIQWHNLVLMSGFEDDQELDPSLASTTRMWDPDRYGWSIMDGTFGQIDQKQYSANSSSKEGQPRRNGITGLQLGENYPFEYPGDEVVASAQDLIESYNNLADGWINYPKSQQRKLYTDIPDTIYNLLKNTSNLVPDGGFEDPESLSGMRGESSKAENTDEDAYSGERSLKISEMKYAWSGWRFRLPATADSIFRIAFSVKGSGKNSMSFTVQDNNPTDWDGSDIRTLTNTPVDLSDDWKRVTLDVNTKGPTQGIAVQSTVNDFENYSYYIDDVSFIDITGMYSMQEICGDNLKAKAIIDSLIADSALTSEKYAQGMKEVAKIIIADEKVDGIIKLVPVLEDLYKSKVSAEAGVTYTVKTMKPGRTYKLECRAWLENPDDKVIYTVKHGNEVLATWETNSQKWTEEFVTFVAPEDGTATIEIWKPAGIGAAHVDDVEVREYDPKVYKLRTKSKYIENNDLETGEVWPWYTMDTGASVELAPTDKDTSLKVTNGRAMQDVVPLTMGKYYKVSADIKLAMPGVDSKEAELKIHIIDSNTNGTRTIYDIGKAKVNNNTWTHIEGALFADKSFVYDSIGFTAGLTDGKGTFYLENAKIEEMPMPTTPGTGDGMTFEQMMADTKGWISTSAEQGLILNKNGISTVNGNIGYYGETLRDFRITFDMKIEGYDSSKYPSMTLRCDSDSPTYGNGYTFIIRPNLIELQKYGAGSNNYLFVGTPENPAGIYGPAKQTTAFKMEEWNTVTVGTQNVENGVHIYLEVNGEVIYDYTDVVSTKDNAGYITFCRNFTNSISIRPHKD